uniref:Uncharacterized protein n=1 Tax=Oryza brachyantha TaxID=4533 RepID=J3MGP7_ORYBR
MLSESIIDTLVYNLFLDDHHLSTKCSLMLSESIIDTLVYNLFLDDHHLSTKCSLMLSESIIDTLVYNLSLQPLMINFSSFSGSPLLGNDSTHGHESISSCLRVNILCSLLGRECRLQHCINPRSCREVKSRSAFSCCLEREVTLKSERIVSFFREVSTTHKGELRNKVLSTVRESSEVVTCPCPAYPDLNSSLHASAKLDALAISRSLRAVKDCSPKSSFSDTQFCIARDFSDLRGLRSRDVICGQSDIDKLEG